MVLEILKALCRIDAWMQGKNVKYSKSIEGNAAFMSPLEKLWWGYKYFYQPVEMGEKGKQIEEYFAKRSFDLVPPKDFIEDAKICLTAGGDILASHHIRPDNTANLWDEAKDFFFQTDICCANLETPFVPSMQASYVPKNILKAPALNNNSDMLNVFTQNGNGIQLFSTANNHCLDMGEEGLLETISFLELNHILHVGTSDSFDQRDDFPVIEQNGIRVAFLSYTFSTNGKPVPENKEYLTNYIRLNMPNCNLDFIKHQIELAKMQKKADLVVACVHWSLEFETYPIQNVIDMGHKLIHLGIDCIIGNHPHNIQPMEVFPFIDPYTKVAKKGVIFYALGDLISCHDHIPNSKLNLLVKLQYKKGTIQGKKAIILAGLQIRPMYIHAKMDMEECIDYRLLDLIKLKKKIDKNEDINFTRQEVEEIERLYTLMNKLLHQELFA